MAYCKDTGLAYKEINSGLDAALAFEFTHPLSRFEVVKGVDWRYEQKSVGVTNEVLSAALMTALRAGGAHFSDCDNVLLNKTFSKQRKEFLLKVLLTVVNTAQVGDLSHQLSNAPTLAWREICLDSGEYLDTVTSWLLDCEGLLNGTAARVSHVISKDKRYCSSVDFDTRVALQSDNWVRLARRKPELVRSNMISAVRQANLNREQLKAIVSLLASGYEELPQAAYKLLSERGEALDSIYISAISLTLPQIVKTDDELFGGVQ